jgi:hypothetical protein
MATKYLSTDELFNLEEPPTMTRGGVRIKEHQWADFCTGTREALADTGIYTGPWPGDEGQRKHTLHTTKEGFEYARVQRKGRKNFEVCLALLPEQAAQRKALVQARIAHAERTKALHLVQAEIDGLPKTAAAYRTYVAEMFERFTPLHHNGAAHFDGLGGYTFTFAAKAEIDEALEAVKTAILKASVVKSEKDLAQNVQEIKARLIRDDAALAFVQSLRAGAARE